MQELDRDEQLVKFIEEKEQNQQQQSKVGPRQRAFSANSYYDSVAIPEARFKIVNGVQARIILNRSRFWHGVICCSEIYQMELRS